MHLSSGGCFCFAAVSRSPTSASRSAAVPVFAARSAVVSRPLCCGGPSLSSSSLKAALHHRRCFLFLRCCLICLPSRRVHCCRRINASLPCSAATRAVPLLEEAGALGFPAVLFLVQLPAEWQQGVGDCDVLFSRDDTVSVAATSVQRATHSSSLATQTRRCPTPSHPTLPPLV